MPTQSNVGLPQGCDVLLHAGSARLVRQGQENHKYWDV
jgi:hypothetical protein